MRSNSVVALHTYLLLIDLTDFDVFAAGKILFVCSGLRAHHSSLSLASYIREYELSSILFHPGFVSLLSFVIPDSFMCA